MAKSSDTYRLAEGSKPGKSATAEPKAGPGGHGKETEVKGEVKARPIARLVSLDAYRGFIMMMLAASGFGIAGLARTPDDSPLWKLLDRPTWEQIAFHFEHPPWASNFLPGSTDPQAGSPWLRVGVSFWDLIQPAFMFMVGVAMPFSYARRKALGDKSWRRTAHAFVRAVILVLLGVFLYSLRWSQTNWIFTNVLAQIGLGYFFVYLLLGRPLWVQLNALSLILIGTTAAFALYGVTPDYEPAAVNADPAQGEVYEGRFAPWSKNGNAAHAFDVAFLNMFPRPPKDDPFEFNAGGYQTLNFVPSIGTMILGLLCGQLLLSHRSHKQKLLWLIGSGALCLVVGVAAGATCCPIVKRIWTPSWTLFSGAYVIWGLALFYLLFDMLPLKKLAFPLVVIGMNSITAYMMGQLLRGWFLDKVVLIHFGGVMRYGLGWLGTITGAVDRLGITQAEAGQTMYELFQPVVNATSAFLVMWLILYWMYRQRYFVRI